MSSALLFDPATFRREVEKMKAKGLITLKPVFNKPKREVKERKINAEFERRLARAQMSDEQFETFLQTVPPVRCRYRIQKIRQHDIEFLRTAVCACGCGKKLPITRVRSEYLPHHKPRKTPENKKSTQLLELLGKFPG